MLTQRGAQHFGLAHVELGQTHKWSVIDLQITHNEPCLRSTGPAQPTFDRSEFHDGRLLERGVGYRVTLGSGKHPSHPEDWPPALTDELTIYTNLIWRMSHASVSPDLAVRLTVVKNPLVLECV